MTETWRPVVGFESIYEVSSWGRVKRIAPGGGAKIGRILRPQRRAKGYLRVALHDGRPHDVSVHRVVALAFLAPPFGGRDQVNHIDGDPANNHVENLEWCTNAENMAHSIEVLARSRCSVGERNGRAKLDWARVAAIRSSADTGTSLAATYGVSESLIGAVRRREIWREAS